MQAKLFMIPWLIELVYSQRVVPPVANPAAQPPQVLTNDPILDAHRRHFLEMLRRQQQINDALLLNNALLHPHPLPPLHIPTAPTDPLLPPAPQLFNPFAPAQQNQGSTSKLGTYGKDDEEKKSDSLPSESSSSEKDGTVEAPQRTDLVKKTLAGVKTVSILKKSPSESVIESDIHPIPPTTTTISPEDLEVVQLFKKLNLSKEETKSIVERVEQVVREKLMSKKLEEEVITTVATTPTTTTTTTVAPTTTTTVATTTTTQASTTTTTETPTTEEYVEVEEDYVVETTSAVPQMHIRNEEREQNLVLLQRNNLKHHPIKLHEKKQIPDTLESALESEEISQGSIKTSLTHLPIFVANEEEDVASQNLKGSSSLHKRILIASQDREKENDRDLLVDFATGAPLDLTADTEVTKKNPEALPVATSPVYSTLPTATSRPVAPPRLNYHERTDFERLASDYRRRLEHTGDINKILQKISENAYISLVERGGRRKLFGN